MSARKLSRRVALRGGVAAVAMAGTAVVAVAAAPQDPLVPLGAAYDKAEQAEARLDAEILGWPDGDPRINDPETDDLLTELGDRKWDVIDRIAVIMPTSIMGAAVVCRVLTDLHERGGYEVSKELTSNLRDGLDRLAGAS